MTYDCPVCKQSAIKGVNANPHVIETDVEFYYHYIDICDNCNNVYCYKIEVTDSSLNDEEKK